MNFTRHKEKLKNLKIKKMKRLQLIDHLHLKYLEQVKSQMTNRNLTANTLILFQMAELFKKDNKK
jgi:hypothetical protein